MQNLKYDFNIKFYEKVNSMKVNRINIKFYRKVNSMKANRKEFLFITLGKKIKTKFSFKSKLYDYYGIGNSIATEPYN